jgi:hypothetical protein
MAELTVGAQAAFALAAHEAEQLGSRLIETKHLFLGLCAVLTFSEGLFRPDTTFGKACRRSWRRKP